MSTVDSCYIQITQVVSSWEWIEKHAEAFVMQMLLLYVQSCSANYRNIADMLSRSHKSGLLLSSCPQGLKISPWLSPLQVRIGQFHISWGWQVHTDLILSLETVTRPQTRFICRSPTVLHRGDGWSDNRWRSMKHQQPDLWVHLSIKSSTGYATACCRSRLVTVNSHNWPWTPASRWRKPPF